MYPHELVSWVNKVRKLDRYKRSGSPLPRTLASLSESEFGGEGLGVRGFSAVDGKDDSLSSEALSGRPRFGSIESLSNFHRI